MQRDACCRRRRKCLVAAISGENLDRVSTAQCPGLLLGHLGVERLFTPLARFFYGLLDLLASLGHHVLLLQHHAGVHRVALRAKKNLDLGSVRTCRRRLLFGARSCLQRFVADLRAVYLRRQPRLIRGLLPF